jgi:hypothetical protein
MVQLTDQPAPEAGGGAANPAPAENNAAPAGSQPANNAPSESKPQ